MIEYIFYTTYFNQLIINMIGIPLFSKGLFTG